MLQTIFYLILFLSISTLSQTTDAPKGNLDRLRELLAEDDPEKIRFCAFQPSDSVNCDTCVAKGDECFFCGGKKQQCLPYSVTFPNCDLDDVKHKNCWVNWTAVIIVGAVAAGLLLIIVIVVLCCCICKLRTWRNRRNKVYWQRKDEKHQMRMKDIETKGAERSSQRAREMDYYREKYGLKKNTTAS
ncbi:unnamed protein product, partial [Mesorhabditis belari]|uniref:Uncharacterized protein n=1 Tax=Mesorhabditis belari TaxID=2138241 RepID=A0AAF3EBC6_9BILA